MSKGYSKAKIFQIGLDNYKTLAKYCDILLEEGYWEKPATVLNKSIDEMLDLYIQAVLVQMAISCDCYNSDECKYIAEIPKNNMIGMNLPEVMKEDILYQAQKVLAAPPILLQLFSLRDIEKSTSMAGMFFDALLNLLLAMAYLNDSKNRQLTSFILGYFKQVGAFLKSSSKLNYSIDERYVFRKISCEELEFCNAFLQTSNGDFEHYKDKYIFNRNRNRTKIPEPIQAKKGIYFDKDCQEKLEEEFYDDYLPREEEDGKRRTNSDVYEKLRSDDPHTSKKIINNSLEDYSTEYTKDFVVKLDLEKNKADYNNYENDNDDNDNDENNESESLDKLLEELYSLIGLDSVKSEINSLINLIKVRKLREEFNMPMMEMSYHMVYTGNPGTGKTTVARLVAKIYKELGLLSEGTMVETDRSGLIAGFVGQTALKVKEVVERAIGGVLFIDEAYSLASGIGTNDFGGEAIDTLVKLMEDHRDNLVVIVAGYRDEMQNFLKANTGLISRFNKFIEFADYTNEELLLILKSMAEKAGLMIDEAALQSVYEKLLTLNEKEQMQFGNARGIRNVFEKIVVNQANRIVTYEKPTKEQLSEIQSDDVLNVL